MRDILFQMALAEHSKSWREGIQYGGESAQGKLMKAAQGRPPGPVQERKGDLFYSETSGRAGEERSGQVRVQRKNADQVHTACLQSVGRA